MTENLEQKLQELVTKGLISDEYRDEVLRYVENRGEELSQEAVANTVFKIIEEDETIGADVLNAIKSLNEIDPFLIPIYEKTERVVERRSSDKAKPSVITSSTIDISLPKGVRRKAKVKRFLGKDSHDNFRRCYQIPRSLARLGASGAVEPRYVHEDPVNNEWLIIDPFLEEDELCNKLRGKSAEDRIRELRVPAYQLLEAAVIARRNLGKKDEDGRPYFARTWREVFRHPIRLWNSGDYIYKEDPGDIAEYREKVIGRAEKIAGKRFDGNLVRRLMKAYKRQVVPSKKEARKHFSYPIHGDSHLKNHRSKWFDWELARNNDLITRELFWLYDRAGLDDEAKEAVVRENYRVLMDLEGKEKDKKLEDLFVESFKAEEADENLMWTIRCLRDAEDQNKQGEEFEGIKVDFNELALIYYNRALRKYNDEMCSAVKDLFDKEMPDRLRYVDDVELEQLVAKYPFLKEESAEDIFSMSALSSDPRRKVLGDIQGQWNLRQRTRLPFWRRAVSAAGIILAIGAGLGIWGVISHYIIGSAQEYRTTVKKAEEKIEKSDFMRLYEEALKPRWEQLIDNKIQSDTELERSWVRQEKIRNEIWEKIGQLPKLEEYEVKNVSYNAMNGLLDADNYIFWTSGEGLLTYTPVDSDKMIYPEITLENFWGLLRDYDKICSRHPDKIVSLYDGMNIEAVAELIVGRKTWEKVSQNGEVDYVDYRDKLGPRQRELIEVVYNCMGMDEAYGYMGEPIQIEDKLEKRIKLEQADRVAAEWEAYKGEVLKEKDPIRLMLTEQYWNNLRRYAYLHVGNPERMALFACYDQEFIDDLLKKHGKWIWSGIPNSMLHLGSRVFNQGTWSDADEQMGLASLRSVKLFDAHYKFEGREFNYNGLGEAVLLELEAKHKGLPPMSYKPGKRDEGLSKDFYESQMKGIEHSRRFIRSLMQELETQK